LSLEWKREGVMDDDSGNAGKDELTCVRSDESDTFRNKLKTFTA